MSLREKTKVGFAWSTANRFSALAITFGVQVVLARLLPTSDFGLIATVSIFILLARLIVDAGFGDALVQATEVARRDVSSVFCFNLVVSAAMVGLLTYLAPSIATFYQEPQLSELLPVVSWNLVIAAVGVTQLKMLTRNLQFNLLYRVSVPAQITGGIIGVVLALLGYGVWSLVVQLLATTAMTSAFAWIACDHQWRPRLEFHASSLRRMFPFGVGVMGAHVMSTVQQNAYGLLIGKVFSMNDLGFYDRAMRTQRLPVDTVASPLFSVLFPAFSSIQRDPPKIASTLRREFPLLCFVVFPAMFLLVVSAEPLIVFLFGERWLPAADYLRLFPFVGMVYPLSAVNLSVLSAMGRSGTMFVLAAIRAGLALAVLGATYQYGIMVIVIGQAVLAWIGYAGNAYFAGRTMGFPMTEQFACLLRYFGIGCLAAFFTWGIQQLYEPDAAAIQLAYLCLTYSLWYVLLAGMLNLSGFQRACELTKTAMSKAQDRLT